MLHVYLLFATMMKDSVTSRMHTLAMTSNWGLSGGGPDVLNQTLHALTPCNLNVGNKGRVAPVAGRSSDALFIKFPSL